MTLHRPLSKSVFDSTAAAFSFGNPSPAIAEHAPSVHGTIDQRFRAEWRPLVALDGIVAQWRALARRALEPNVFYEPAFALAAAGVFGRGVGAGLVWACAGSAQLVGLFPARIERRRYGISLPVLVGWTHPFGPLGTPLIDRDAGTAVISAWLDHVAASPDLPELLLMPYLPADGPLARAFDAALARRDGTSIAFNRHRRALLAPPGSRSPGSRSDYLDTAIGPKKRKELRRQRKRLAEVGAVTSSIVSAAPEVTAALGDFLALEATGWKGRAGTAASADADARTFMQNAIAGLAREGRAQVGRLFVGDRPIAAIVTLSSGDAAWCWKIAYDESFARFSPGVQLLSDVTQALLDDPSVASVDSCASADHPMIDHIWRERLALSDRLARLTSEQSVSFALAARLEALRRRAIAAAKALRKMTRSPCKAKTVR
jgi:CelD/BcsL family acetyltransferase involved in cellulose biosynthesis